MPLQDIISVFQWWTTIFLIGIIFAPITSLIFSSFFDKGYIFAKIIGIVFISYAVFVLGFLKILPFTEINVALIITAFLVSNIFLISKYLNILISLRKSWKIFLFEEILFFAILLFWSFIHAHQPEIHGLEKYMDYGFINSILRTKYFPPLDMWLTPLPINYYYFGHLVTAVLTKFSFLPSQITFNLMLSTITALSFVSAFSIGANLFDALINKKRVAKEEGLPTARILAKPKEHWREGLLLTGPVFAGLLTAFILNFAGNLHALYLFFKPYANENPVPFWSLIFSPQTFPNNYWYPNATRFIHNTIHEFPIYSNVVSDLHGHFLDIPFVLLTIAVLLSLFLKPELKIANCKLKIALMSFLLAVTYMTNAWDGIIYFLLTIFVFCHLIFKNTKLTISSCLPKFKTLGLYSLIIALGFFIITAPFNLNFKPFASGIGLLCAPKFLTDLGKFGPFLFETNHCQHSPAWQLLTLYGFFYFWVASFIISLKLNAKRYTLNASDIFVFILIILSTILIVIPEFIYVKDIYPAHYRANTMFKLVYESFIMLSISSGYIIVRLLNWKLEIGNWKFIYWSIGSIFLLIIFLYPYFAINSYFGNLKTYSGLNGTNYLKSLYPNDYDAILWINKNIKGQPVILEAQGDSYTDYARVSTNTGLPTVLGWTVHEWLWRGTYDIPAPRIAEVMKMYESENLEEAKTLLKKYRVSLVFVGDLEKQKYPNLSVEKFELLGKIIYQKGDTKLFEMNLK